MERNEYLEAFGDLPPFRHRGDAGTGPVPRRRQGPQEAPHSEALELGKGAIEDDIERNDVVATGKNGTVVVGQHQRLRGHERGQAAPGQQRGRGGHGGRAGAPGRTRVGQRGRGGKGDSGNRCSNAGSQRKGTQQQEAGERSEEGGRKQGAARSHAGAGHEGRGARRPETREASSGREGEAQADMRWSNRSASGWTLTPATARVARRLQARAPGPPE